MQSDSLIRLLSQPPIRPHSQIRNEINSQVEQFLARGGEIEVCPTRIGDPPPNTLRGTGQQMDKWPVDSTTHHINIGGIPHISMNVCCNMTGYAPNTIRKRVADKSFPPPKMKHSRLYFPKAAVMAWMALRDEQ